MLKIHYSREGLYPEKLEKRTLVLVPDQFTLEAEKACLKSLKQEGFLDLEVLSPTRLRDRVLAEQGRAKAEPIDKYGRHMLLSRILARERENLSLYRGVSRADSFVELINDAIYEFKQNELTAEDVVAMADKLDKGTILKRKLADIALIYEKYTAYLEGRYMDDEDYATLFIGRIGNSELIRDAEVWVEGFDTFTPKSMSMLTEIMKVCSDMHLVLYPDELTKDTAERLTERADEAGVAWEAEAFETAEPLPVFGGGLPKLRVVEAANVYAEAETAAAQVLELTREKGMKHRDIVLICNDPEGRGDAIKRVFGRYGLDLFVDTKTKAAKHPALIFVSCLLDTISHDYRPEDVLGLLKTGYFGIDTGSVEDIENYVIKYRVRKKGWSEPFTRGLGADYDLAEMDALNVTREAVYGKLGGFDSDFHKARKAGDKIRVLYAYLRDTVALPTALAESVAEDRAAERFERADRTSQVWGLLVSLLSQMDALMGGDVISDDDFATVLASGFEAMEIGTLPPSADALLMGTMQRTRTSEVKAVLVLCANEGLLPSVKSDASLINDDEKRALFERADYACKLEEMKSKEELAGIYKNLNKPSDLLYLSYSLTDLEGKEAECSSLVTELLAMNKGTQVEKDIREKGGLDLIQSRESAVDDLAKALRGFAAGEELAEEWQALLAWYEKNEPETLSAIYDGLLYANSDETLSADLAEKLFARSSGTLALSSSRIESFAHCPFKYFVGSGLRPEEIRGLDIDYRDVGDIYHGCFKYVSEKLTGEGQIVFAEDSDWSRATPDRIEKLVDEYFDSGEAKSYRGGVFDDSEAARYRKNRIRKVCVEMMTALASQVNSGSIRSMRCEVSFGIGKDIPAVEVDLGNGRKAFVEGKIDRLDELADGRIKVIDYKTSDDKFSPKFAASGWKPQLMIYLQAAQGEEKKPAGVFYFHVDENPPKIEKGKREEKQYKMHGVLLDDPKVIEEIAGDFDGNSDIVTNLRKNKDGKIGGSSLLSEEDFETLQREVATKVKELARELYGGKVKAEPMKVGGDDACKFCEYKGICLFDKAFKGCEYVKI